MSDPAGAERPVPRVVAVGASAGGVEAARDLIAGLGADFPAPVLVVLHMAAHAPSALPAILGRRAHLPVVAADDGKALLPGRVFVCRPDHHLLVRDGILRLGHGARENGHRPAVDTLFRSVARWYGPRAVAVVLSGALDDGAAGALAVAARGGSVLVQDPGEALYSGMPSATLRAVGKAQPASLAELPALLTQLVEAPFDAPPDPEEPRDLVMETDMAELEESSIQHPDRPGVPSGLACPDCHGVLFEVAEEPIVRFRCRVGHAWSAESLLVEQHEEVERALWVALRAVEERAALHDRLGESALQAGRQHVASMSRERASEAKASAEVIRELLERHVGSDSGTSDVAV